MSWLPAGGPLAGANRVASLWLLSFAVTGRVASSTVTGGVASLSSESSGNAVTGRWPVAVVPGWEAASTATRGWPRFGEVVR